MFRSGNMTLIIFSEEMNEVIKIIKLLEVSGLIIKDVSKTIKNEAKEKKGEFLSMLLWILGASLLDNLWTGKSTIKAVNDTVSAGQDFKCHLIL